MSIQIQAKIKHIFGKIISLALLLFILVGFGLRTIGSNAQAGTPAPAPATPAASKPKTPTPATPSTPTGNAPDKLDGRIGTVKECSVDTGSISKEDLKTDSSKANTFIYNCLKDVLRIVITISIILAIMKMMWVGIKHLNTFGEQAALTKELSETITGFVVGALILGLFATFIQVINPAALRIDKIFSPKVIDDYKCLNKGLTGASLPGGGCKDQGKSNSTSNGSGTTTTGTGSKPTTSEEIEKILNSTDVKVADQKRELQERLIQCNNNYALQGVNCSTLEQGYTGTGIDASDTVEQTGFNASSGNIVANGDYIFGTKQEEGASIIISAKYSSTKYGKPFAKNLTFKTGYVNECKDEPMFTSEKISKGEILVNKGKCIIAINN